MKKIFRNLFLACLILTVFSGTSLAKTGRKSLVGDTDKMSVKYGYGFKIDSNHSKVIQAIRESGKSDFSEGLYASFRPEGNKFSLSRQDVTIKDIKDYTMLEFDIISMTEKRFGDLEAYMDWVIGLEEGKYKGFGDYANYEEYKADFDFSNTRNVPFKLQEVNEVWGRKYSPVDVSIRDKNGKVRYIVNASNNWETVQVDISDFEELTMDFELSEAASTIVSNPRLINQRLELRAIASRDRMELNGINIDLEAYNINNNNYFKLRDFAKIIGITDKHFEVKWDGNKRAIDLITNQAYTSVGGELSPGDGSEKKAKINTAKIYKDGRRIDLESYNINGNNYFKLRDLAKSFDIGVDWDGKTRTVKIDTNTGYVEP